MHSHSPKIRKAVLPAAGLGTRLLPATKALPKELLPVLDTPVLQILVEEAVAAGCEEIIFVVNTGKEAIWNHFAPHHRLERLLAEKGKLAELAALQKIYKQAHFSFVLQHEQLGDGHAILQARSLVGDEPFLVLFGDDIVRAAVPVAAQLAAVYERTGSAVVALQKIPREKTGSYGVIVPGDRADRLVEIRGFVEKPTPAEAPSEFAIVGKYVCPPEIFAILESCPAASGEMRLIDALAELQKTQPVIGWLFDGQRFDTGDKFGYFAATVDAALHHPEIGTQAAAYLRELVGKFPAH